MSADDGVIVFVGTHPDTESAQADYEVVRELEKDIDEVKAQGG